MINYKEPNRQNSFISCEAPITNEYVIRLPKWANIIRLPTWAYVTRLPTWAYVIRLPHWVCHQIANMSLCHQIATLSLCHQIANMSLCHQIANMSIYHQMAKMSLCHQIATHCDRTPRKLIISRQVDDTGKRHWSKLTNELWTLDPIGYLTRIHNFPKFNLRCPHLYIISVVAIKRAKLEQKRMSSVRWHQFKFSCSYSFISVINLRISDPTFCYTDASM